MSIEDELTQIAQRMFKEHRSFLLDRKLLNDAVAAYVRAYAIRELEQLPKLIARIKDQENTPEYLVVDAREITKAIARLNGKHDQPNN